MHVIVGLGNPGNEYLNTRHNVGFEVVEKIAGDLKIRWKAGKGQYLVGKGRARGLADDREIVLVMPLTYMNNSGEAVADVVELYELELDHLLVVCDDFQIPLGTLRLRPRGSDGGHNGLYSIIYTLQSDEFARLRCGIGSERMPLDKKMMADFVLDQFSPEESPAVRSMVERAADACLSFVENGIARTMNEFN